MPSPRQPPRFVALLHGLISQNPSEHLRGIAGQRPGALLHWRVAWQRVRVRKGTDRTRVGCHESVAGRYAKYTTPLS